MGIRKLGVRRPRRDDVDAWTDLLGRTLGIGVTTEKSGTDEVTLAELDMFKYRLALYPAAHGQAAPRGSGSSTRRPNWTGSPGGSPTRDTPVEDGTPQEARLRGATRLRRFTDPVGYRVELAVGRPRRAPPSPRRDGTQPGATGLGHFVLASPRLEGTARTLRERSGVQADRLPAPGLYFLRCNPTHHSIALAHADTASLHHLEFEHGSIDDVGRSYDRAKANGAPISISLGRHMNDKALSFYVRNPSGFHLEIGCGGIEVGEDWVPHDFGVSDVWGHHHAEANPFASPAS
ncbi:VOC family protein [Streptomyces sp. PG2]